MNSHKITITLCCLGMAALLTGCSTTKVERIDVDKTVDLSGQWNDTDARMVAEEMITDCLKGTWLGNYYKSSARPPVVIVGAIDNISSEHINPLVFIKSLERSLLNSGKVTFVASRNERVTVREERTDQHMGTTSPETVNPLGKETGADFMLQGSINSVIDEVKGKAVSLYQVNLELVDLTTNEVTWLGQTQIKKLIKRSRTSY